MIKFGTIEVKKEVFYGANKLIKVQGVDVNNIIFSQSVKVKKRMKGLNGYQDDVMRPLTL